jgi:leucyl-tRNA synthetase
MDTFVDSAWYFMRYCDPHDSAHMVGPGAAYWMPMDQYIGGIEHAILHLLYARFWTKAMRDLGLVSVSEPFSRLLTQGMVLNHTYSYKNDKGGVTYFGPQQVQNQHDASGKIIGATLKAAQDNLSAGTAVHYAGLGTMSKSKNNGVDPQALIEKYGADTARLYTIFTAPPEATLEWSDAGVEGAYRFLRRIWSFGLRVSGLTHAYSASAADCANNPKAQALRLEIHSTFKQIDYDYQRMQYNTVVSGTMKLLNALEDFADDGAPSSQAALQEGFGILLRTLYPVAPHITHALWQNLGYATLHGDLLDAAWPQVDESALHQNQIELVLQVNGKLRGAVLVPANADRATIEQAALAHPALVKLAGATAKKVIVVPGRLVNVVI